MIFMTDEAGFPNIIEVLARNKNLPVVTLAVTVITPDSSGTPFDPVSRCAKTKKVEFPAEAIDDVCANLQLMKKVIEERG